MAGSGAFVLPWFTHRKNSRSIGTMKSAFPLLTGDTYERLGIVRLGVKEFNNAVKQQF